MSYQPLWLRDLVAYSIQAAALVGVGVGMASLLRLRVPRVRMAHWQGLVALCLFLPLLQPWRPEVVETSGTVLSNVTLDAAAPVPTQTVSLAQIVLWLICAGIALRASWMALGMLRLWLYRREAKQIDEVPEAVAEAQTLVPVSARFFISSRLQTPATFGYFRPAILFPARFLKMEPSMQKAIALHELLHVERRDWLWNLLEEAVLSVLWFHLPLWWAVRSIRLSREQVVDAEAVRRGNARRPYLKALLEMAGQQRLAESLPAALFLRESQLAERVALMMKEVQMTRKRLTVSIVAAAGAVLIAGASVVWAFPLQTHAQPQTAPPVSSAASDTSLPGNSSAAAADSTQKGARIYKIGGEVSAPVPIFKPEPPYTPEARKAHLSGTVVLRTVIDAKGHVVKVKKLSKPLGKGLDESAMNTVRTWKFNPAMRNGVPVPVKAMVEVSFRYDHNKKIDPPPQSPNAATDPPSSAAEAGVTQNRARVYEVGGDVTAPEPLDSPDPPYTPQARRNHLTGTVVLSCVVDSKGKVSEVTEQSKPLGKGLDESAIKTVRTWKFKPATRHGVPVPVKVMMQVSFRYDRSKKSDPAAEKPDPHPGAASQKPNPANDPPAQGEQSTSANKDQSQHNSTLNQAEIQQQVEQAMKQAAIAQRTAAKIDQAKIQRQVEKAMKQARLAQQAVPKMDEAKMQRQIEQAMKQAKIAQQAASKIDQTKIQEQIDKAMKQLKIAQITAPRIDEAKIQRQIEQAIEQAKIAQQATEKIDKMEIGHQLEQARRQIQQAQKQAEMARQEAYKARKELKKQRKEVKPLPAEPPKPPSPSSIEVAPPLVLPSPPAPPSRPQSE